MAEPNAGALLAAAYGGDSPQDAMRRAVDRLLAHGEVSGPPAPLELLASLRDVRDVEVIEIERAGHLVPREEGGYLIQVNGTEWPGRQRFSIAHEICHTFFDELRHTASAHAAAALTFASDTDEESLCDIGAAHMLLHPDWLRRLAGSRPPSLDALYELAETFRASVEAAALQLAMHGVWRCSFIYWEPGYRESERRLLESRRGRSAAALPVPKLRAKRIYTWSGAPFFPRRKSVENSTTIAQALHLQARTSGRERFEIGERALEADCESDYTGYTDASGVPVQRVLTLMRWR